MFKSKKSRQLSVPVGITLGIILSVMVSVAASAIFAGLMEKETISQNSGTILTIVTHLLSTLCGSWFASALTKQRRLLVCLCSGGGYFLTLLACTALFFGSQYSNVVAGLIATFVGSGAIALAGIRRKKSGKMKLKRPAYR